MAFGTETPPSFLIHAQDGESKKKTYHEAKKIIIEFMQEPHEAPSPCACTIVGEG